MALRKILSIFTLALLLFGCGEEPSPAKITIAALGDSLTAGYGLPAKAAFPAQLETYFHANGYTGVSVLNFGVSGETTKDGLMRLNAVLAAQPDIAIVALGANDLLKRQPAEAARTNLTAIIQQLKAAEIRVILAGIEPPRLFALGNPVMGDYPPMFREVAKAQNVTLYEDFLEGVQNKPKLNLDDRLHPNADGVALMVENIFPTVKEVVHEHLDAAE